MNSVGFGRLAVKVLFTAALAAGCIWYLSDAASQSTSPANLLLILPATLIVVVLCVGVIVDDVLAWRRADRAACEAERLDWAVSGADGPVALYVSWC
jgi:predicted dinucleotide-utilizing enzyme